MESEESRLTQLLVSKIAYFIHYMALVHPVYFHIETLSEAGCPDDFPRVAQASRYRLSKIANCKLRGLFTNIKSRFFQPIECAWWRNIDERDNAPNTSRGKPHWPMSFSIERMQNIGRKPCKVSQKHNHRRRHCYRTLRT